MLLSERWWCPRCGIERTGDAMAVCACMSKPQRREDRYFKAIRTPRVSSSGTGRRVRGLVIFEGGKLEAA